MALLRFSWIIYANLAFEELCKYFNHKNLITELNNSDKYVVYMHGKTGDYIVLNIYRKSKLNL